MSTKKIALITGANKGIGLETARQLGQQGITVLTGARDETKAGQAAEKLRKEGIDARGIVIDVNDAASIQKAAARIESDYGRLDILVNNAGIGHVGSIENTTEADLDQLYRVNVKGVFLCSQAALATMLRQGGGVILNLASIASLIGVPDRFAYSMSKGAVLTMTKSIAVDYVKRNIRCNCICPARVHTPFVDEYVAKNYPGREREVLQQLSEYQPLGRMGTAEEVATLALYLCSDEASFVTGQAYPIDGGVLNQ